MRTVLVAILFVGSVQAAEPQPTSRTKPPTVKVAAAGGHDGQVFLVGEVSNPNLEPLPFVGYTPESFEGGLKAGTIFPIYKIELLQEKKWKPVPIGWCGTGIGPVSIPARGTVTFGVMVPAGEWEAAKVGLSWYRAGEKNPDTAWSDPINRKDAIPKKP